MIREVLTYPDKRLKLVSCNIESFDNALCALLDDMYETMLHKGGIGLAAIQIGVRLNVLIINPSNEEGRQEKEDLIEMINPSILETKGVCLFQEGCLSIPNIYEDIERAEVIRVRFFDRFGKEHEEEYSGIMAIAVQHEIDHLKGKLFIERFTYLKRKKFEKEWKKRVKDKKLA